MIIQLLKKALSDRLKILKDINVVDSSSVSLINKTRLLDAQRKIQQEIRSTPKPSKMLFKAASIQSEAMKIHYALELIQTQGVNALKNYFQRMGKQASSKDSPKASRAIMSDYSILEAIAFLKSLDVEHPKIREIEEIVRKQVEMKPDSKIIVFTHYRDTSLQILSNLEKISGIKPVRFIGQAVKDGDKGLTQKEQIQIIQKFKENVYNVLIATSVAEEGLDIPSTDLVVFYEPVPSEIRVIQRRGRTGRKMPGNVIILITKGTSDEGYYWAAKRKEKRMRSELEMIRSKLGKKFEDAEAFYRKEVEGISDQKTLKDYENRSDQLKIIVDHREYRSNVVKNLVVKGVSVEPQQLDVGDYVLSSRIGVERKEVDDYLESPNAGGFTAGVGVFLMPRIELFGNVAISSGTPWWELDLSVPSPYFFDDYRSDYADTDTLSEPPTFKRNVLSFGLNVYLMRSDRWNLYIGGGGSYVLAKVELIYNVTYTQNLYPLTSDHDVTIDSVTFEESDVDAFGFNIRAGGDFRIGKNIYLFAEGIYIMAKAEPEYPLDTDVTLEFDLGGMSSAFGIKIYF